MWRWIAAITVLVGTFGLGMWSAFCMGPSRPSIDIVWEADDSWQRVGVDFDGSETGVRAFRNIGVDADGNEIGVPMHHCDQCPAASSEPNKICSVEVLPCPDQLPEDLQRVVEIARSRPSAAAGTMFDDPANDIAFVEALSEVAEQSNDEFEVPVGEPVVIAPLPGDTFSAVPSLPLSRPDVATSNCPLGTKEGGPLAVNDATACAKAPCDEIRCDESACELSACARTCPPCDTACQDTACDAATCTADVCESTCSQTPCSEACSAAETVTKLLYERAREMDAKAWELEEAGEYGLADRLRDIASEMRGSARVARASAAGLR